VKRVLIEYIGAQAKKGRTWREGGGASNQVKGEKEKKAFQVVWCLLPRGPSRKKSRSEAGNRKTAHRRAGFLCGGEPFKEDWEEGEEIFVRKFLKYYRPPTG